MTGMREGQGKAQLCWGDCGHWLVFNSVGQGRCRRDVAFQICTGEGHSCPRPAELPQVFLPGMHHCGEPTQCTCCRKQIYSVPTRPRRRLEDVMWFDELAWPWRAHFCPQHAGLPGIADVSPRNLSEQCCELELPKPYRLVTIICVKDTPSPDALSAKNQPACSPVCKTLSRVDPLYIVALKSVLGDKSCSFFRGNNEPRWGDLGALCGSGDDQRLLTNSGQVLKYDGWANAGQLQLSWEAESRTRECSRCRDMLTRLGCRPGRALRQDLAL